MKMIVSRCTCPVYPNKEALLSGLCTPRGLVARTLDEHSEVVAHTCRAGPGGASWVPEGTNINSLLVIQVLDCSRSAHIDELSIMRAIDFPEVAHLVAVLHEQVGSTFSRSSTLLPSVSFRSPPDDHLCSSMTLLPSDVRSLVSGYH